MTPTGDRSSCLHPHPPDSRSVEGLRSWELPTPPSQMSTRRWRARSSAAWDVLELQVEDLLDPFIVSPLSPMAPSSPAPEGGRRRGRGLEHHGRPRDEVVVVTAPSGGGVGGSDFLSPLPSLGGATASHAYLLPLTTANTLFIFFMCSRFGPARCYLTASNRTWGRVAPIKFWF